MMNRIKIVLQYFLPKQLITVLAGWVASREWGRVTTFIINTFIKYYRVDMEEAAKPDPESYVTFNDFFSRALQDNARPFNAEKSVIIQPADGILSEFGPVLQDTLIQAKGQYYNLESLLAGNGTLAFSFKQGFYATIYLSPRDYHRVHMPYDGKLTEMIYVPGSLFSVNSITAAAIPNIFARNERVICYFETEFGPMIQILIGATIVGSIEVPWQGMVAPPRDNMIKRWSYAGIDLAKGDEMGLFKLGSTVITLFAEQSMVFEDFLEKGSEARVGKKLGSYI